ncbi:Abi family protein [Arcanobacterium phocae]|uniref:Abi family protein n=1 Tax=Arcanobacterium phocae TaxID=131112 RepID=UPI001C0EF5DA|nr:Abi family protein [Arcanobacterium phocae]
MAKTKQFKTYSQQVELLRSRGMQIDDSENAARMLAQLNYYRLSGYWYPMRKFDPITNNAMDEFVPGTTFDRVLSLYKFDEKLRHVIFAELDRIEMAFRTMLGYELGKIDPLIHLSTDRLGAAAIQEKRSGTTPHEIWLCKYKSLLKSSKEDFVAHHNAKYDGALPIWAAVEIMDWGMLSHLYGMSPQCVRKNIASLANLSGPQLESWMRTLNVLRNYVAHHARMFNRVYSLKPKLSRDSSLLEIANGMNRLFGQLSLIQYLHRKLELSPATRLPQILKQYPENDIVPFSRTGAPANWQQLDLWLC